MVNQFPVTDCMSMFTACIIVSGNIPRFAYFNTLTAEFTIRYEVYYLLRESKHRMVFVPFLKPPKF
jgi:hypothetical protein